VMDDAAYDGSPMGEPDATVSSSTAPSTAAAPAARNHPHYTPQRRERRNAPESVSTEHRDEDEIQFGYSGSDWS
jgi:hypothetical protein